MKQAQTSSFCRECIPSGALTLDIALGGGFPKGRIIEVPPEQLQRTVCMDDTDSLDYAWGLPFPGSYLLIVSVVKSQNVTLGWFCGCLYMSLWGCPPPPPLLPLGPSPPSPRRPPPLNALACPPPQFKPMFPASREAIHSYKIGHCRYMDQRAVARQHWPCTQWLLCKELEAQRCWWMQSMHLILNIPRQGSASLQQYTHAVHAWLSWPEDHCDPEQSCVLWRHAIHQGFRV